MLQNTFHKIFLKTLAPETAHEMAIATLKLGLMPKVRIDDSTLKTSLWGKTFPNPLGIAAGFDKNAEVIEGLFNLGFGFVEVGTITPKPQAGNPHPRVFRIQKSIFNSLGFNSHGMEKAKTRLEAWHRNGVLGINIGPNKDSVSVIDDYLKLLEGIGHLADYLVLNISSPNIPGLRSLHKKEHLNILLQNVRAKFQGVLVLKLSPDEEDSIYKEVVNSALDLDVNGIIIGNSTQHFYMGRIGGLTGEELADLALQKLHLIYSYTQGRIPLISAGGISTGVQAYERIRAGANLLQLYTAMVYKGFGVVRKILEDLSQLLSQDGYSSVSEAVGVGPRGEIGRRA